MIGAPGVDAGFELVLVAAEPPVSRGVGLPQRDPLRTDDSRVRDVIDPTLSFAVLSR